MALEIRYRNKHRHNARKASRVLLQGDASRLNPRRDVDMSACNEYWFHGPTQQGPYSWRATDIAVQRAVLPASRI